MVLFIRLAIVLGVGVVSISPLGQKVKLVIIVETRKDRIIRSQKTL